MAQKAVRRGDINSAGGIVTEGSKKVTVNGRPMAYKGNSVSPHGCCFCIPPYIPDCIATLRPITTKVTVEGKPASKVGDTDTCGHPRMNGSPNVVIG